MVRFGFATQVREPRSAGQSNRNFGDFNASRAGVHTEMANPLLNELSGGSSMTNNFGLYINGEWCDAASHKTMGIINPATEDVIRHVPYGSRADARRALEAAAAALPAWRAATAYERG